MADFKKAIVGTFKAEGGFQNHADDNANYVDGVLIGTNRGISAQGYHAFYKKVPSVDDMKNLTEEQAKEIFKGNYWDKIGGDFINNQSVAELMFQYIIGSGASQLSDLKDIANGISQNDVDIPEVDKPFTKQECDFINALDQGKYHAALKKWRFAWFDLVVLRNPKKHKFLKGWQNRLNTHIFKP